MALKRGKRKKYPKLPNGFGSIKYLGKGRRNPYAVHPPTTDYTPDGIPKTPKALCYVDDWMTGFAVLNAYRAGNYYPGIEKEMKLEIDSGSDELAQKILADYNRSKGFFMESSKKPTFKDVYDQFYEYKYERDKSRQYSNSSRNSTKAAFKNCAALHDMYFEDIRHKHLQGVIDDCKKKHSSLELIITLFHQMYAYAVAYEIVDRDYSRNVKINIADDDEHGVPFSDDEIEILWKNKDNPIIEFILIMIYSGYRIAAYKNIEVNLSDKYFCGGVKTRASQKRIVPIHSKIFPLVSARMDRDGSLLKTTEITFRSKMYDTLKSVGIQKHTPHDCRHTFSRLCEKYGVNENDRKRLLGHSFNQDITNAVYGHRDLEDLRKEIEKIKICY